MLYRSRDLYDALEPLYYLCKMSGIAPYSLKNADNKTRDRRYETTLFDVLLSLVPNLLLNSLFVLGLRSCSKEYDMIISIISLTVQRYLNVVSYLVNYLAAMANSKRLTKALQVVVKHDAYFKKYSEQIAYKSGRKRVRKALLLAAGANSLNLALDLFTIIQNATSTLCVLVYVMSYTVTVVMECQVYVYLTELAQRLAVLNTVIQQTLQTIPQDEEQLGKLTRCSDVYSELVDVGAALNRAFEAQIAVKLFQSFLYTLTSLFYFLFDMQIGPDLDYLYDYLAFVISAVVSFGEILAIIYAFTRANNEVHIIRI